MKHKQNKTFYSESIVGDCIQNLLLNVIEKLQIKELVKKMPKSIVSQVQNIMDNSIQSNKQVLIQKNKIHFIPQNLILFTDNLSPGSCKQLSLSQVQQKNLKLSQKRIRLLKSHSSIISQVQKSPLSISSLTQQRQKCSIQNEESVVKNVIKKQLKNESPFKSIYMQKQILEHKIKEKEQDNLRQMYDQRKTQEEQKLENEKMKLKILERQKNIMKKVQQMKQNGKALTFHYDSTILNQKILAKKDQNWLKSNQLKVIVKPVQKLVADRKQNPKCLQSQPVHITPIQKQVTKRPYLRKPIQSQQGKYLSQSSPSLQFLSHMNKSQKNIQKGVVIKIQSQRIQRKDRINQSSLSRKQFQKIIQNKGRFNMKFRMKVRTEQSVYLTQSKGQLTFNGDQALNQT